MTSKKNAPFLMGSHEGRQGKIQVGTLKVRADGNGLIRPLAGPPDLFVSRDEACRGLDGDLVKFEIIPTGRKDHFGHHHHQGDVFRGRDSARILEVLEQRRRLTIGTLIKSGPEPVVVAKDARVSRPIPVKNASKFRQGALVKIAMGEGHELGRVLEVMDESASKSVELASAYAQGFSDVFPKPVLKEAEAIPDVIPEDDIQRREDLTHLPFITIDGSDARDFDDAVFAQRLEDNCFRLFVAIADVAHYVPKNSAIDLEALKRGTSVYFPALVLPMLPTRLSNGLCSLNPHEKRLALVVEMDFHLGHHGECAPVGAPKMHEAIIQSVGRCTYEEVESFLENTDSNNSQKAPVPLWSQAIRTSLNVMKVLAIGLMNHRRRHGGIDLEIPAFGVALDDHGRPSEITLQPRLFSHRLIEAFMLAANEAVAAWFEERDLPTIFRIHDKPDAKKLAKCLEIARVHGFGMNLHVDPKQKRAQVTCRQISALVNEMKGHPSETSLNNLVLRSMAQATYSPDNLGHFGLASDAYLHFTSPIRRYPDLEVHRQLKDELHRRSSKSPSCRSKKLTAKSRQALEERLDAIAGRSSERERAAVASERDVHSWAASVVAKKHLGETFDATLTTVTDFGAFVQMHPLNVEGLITPERMGRSRVELDSDHQQLTLGQRKVLTLGSHLRVRIDRVDTELRHVDLTLV